MAAAKVMMSMRQWAHMEVGGGGFWDGFCFLFRLEWKQRISSPFRRGRMFYNE